MNYEHKVKYSDKGKINLIFSKCVWSKSNFPDQIKPIHICLAYQYMSSLSIICLGYKLKQVII